MMMLMMALASICVDFPYKEYKNDHESGTQLTVLDEQYRYTPS